MDPEDEPGFTRLSNQQDGYEGLENPSQATQDASGYTLPQPNRSYQKLFYPNPASPGFKRFISLPIPAYDNQPNLAYGYLDFVNYPDSLPSHSEKFPNQAIYRYVDVMDYPMPFPLRPKRFTKRPISMTTQSLSGNADPTYGYVDVVDYQGYPAPPSGGYINKTVSRVTPHNSRYSRSQIPRNRTKVLPASANPYSEINLHLPK